MEAYESKFLAYKKEILDAVKAFVNDTNKQLKAISTNIASVQEHVGADLEGIQAHLGSELESVRDSLSGDIASLAATMDCAIRSSPNAVVGGTPGPRIWSPEDGAVGKFGHRDDLQHPGKTSASHQPPPVGG